LEHSINYFQSAPFYGVPIYKMWTKLTGRLQNSCCLVFKDLMQYVYWGNSNTKKLTGVQIKIPDNNSERDKLIRYVLSAFSFNCLPVNYIDIVEAEDEEDKISLTHKCYIKSGDTLFTRSSTPYSKIPEDIDITKRGLVQTDNVTPQVLRRRTNITHKLQPFPVKEIEPLTTPYVVSARKRKLELDEMETKKRKLDFTRNTLAVKEEYKEQLAKEQDIKSKENELRSYFRQLWIDMDSKGFYKLYAFVVNKRDNYTHVGVLAETADTKAVYYLKGYSKSRFIDLSNNSAALTSGGFLKLPYATKRGGLIDIIYLPTRDPFCTFRTNGTTSYNGHAYPRVENLQFHAGVLESQDELLYSQDDVEHVNNSQMQSIVGNVKVCDCNRLEGLDEGTELLITAIQQIDYRGKTRYILTFENIQSPYVSNYWLEMEIVDRCIDLNYKIKVKCDKLKTTPSKNKERVMFCV